VLCRNNSSFIFQKEDNALPYENPYLQNPMKRFIKVFFARKEDEK